MTKARVYNSAGQQAEDVQLSEKVFGVQTNMALVHQAVTAELANSRNTVAHTKTRGEVRGGGRKPWKQKGTGRARAGSIRSPIWKGGGVIFGPRSNRNFSQSFNRPQFRKALFMVLSQKLSAKKLFIIEALDSQTLNTKKAVLQINELRKVLNISSKKLNLVIPGRDKNLEYSLRNLSEISVLRVSQLTPYLILKQPVTLIYKTALSGIEKTYLK